MRTKEQILNGMNLIDFLFKCKVDFKFFCEQMLGLTDEGGIHKFQLEWFYAIQNNPRVVIQAPSGFSKTTIVGVAFTLWYIWNYKNKKVLLISKTITQSKDALLMQVREFIEENEMLRDLIPNDSDKTWNTTQLRLSNGDTIINRPYSENIKGYRGDLILLDEVDSYQNPDIYFDYVVSRVNPGGRIAMISTPEKVTALMGLIETKNEALPEKDKYKILKYPAIVNCKIKGDLWSGESIWPERFPMDELESRYSTHGDQFFRKNYMCDATAASEDTIFKPDLVFTCFDKARRFSLPEDGFVVMGCDFAYSDGPRADFDSFVVIEKKDNFFIIKHIEIWKGIKTPVKVSRIQELNETYKPKIIVCDESNIGSTVIDEMMGRGLLVVPQKFSPPQRKDLLMVLKNVVDSGKLIIPRDVNFPDEIKLTDELTIQLFGFKRVKSERTGMDLIDSTAAHDDIVMALAMAVKEATKQNTDSFFEEELRFKSPSLDNPFKL